MRKRGTTNLWYQFWVSDWLTETRGMSLQCKGALADLRAVYWNRQGPLPDDDAHLARIVQIPLAEWKKLRKDLEIFFEVEDGLWVLPWMEEEIIKARDLSEKRRKAANSKKNLTVVK